MANLGIKVEDLLKKFFDVKEDGNIKGLYEIRKLNDPTSDLLYYVFNSNNATYHSSGKDCVIRDINQSNSRYIERLIAAYEKATKLGIKIFWLVLVFGEEIGLAPNGYDWLASIELKVPLKNITASLSMRKYPVGKNMEGFFSPCVKRVEQDKYFNTTFICCKDNNGNFTDEYLKNYLEIFDNRGWKVEVKNTIEHLSTVSIEKHEIKLSTTAKECARQIISNLYEYDKLEKINSILKLNTNIKIDTSEICSEDVLYNVFFTAGSKQFDDEKRTFLGEEYYIQINDIQVPCRLTTQWCGFGETGDDVQSSRNYLWALRDVINIHYDGIFKIENEGANAKLICYSQETTNKNELVFITSYKNDFARNKILFGAPGTGKSYELNQDAMKLVGKISQNGRYVPDSDYYERVTFHPNYSYAQFVGTYKPVTKIVDGKENISYEYVPGAFIRLLVKALKNARDESVHKQYLLVIEEINRANVAAVFGDIFQLLDRDSNGISEYEIETSEDLRKYLSRNDNLGGKSDDYKKIRFPNNFYIWATMNSADQGVFPMDTAFKRRWEFEYIGIDENEDKVKDYEIPISATKKVYWNDLRKAINKKLITLGINEDKLLGPFFLSKTVLDSSLDKGMDFVRLFESKVLMYLFEDAAKMKAKQLFNIDEKKFIYSEVCKKFELEGLKVFKFNEEDVVEEHDIAIKKDDAPVDGQLF